MMLSNTFRFPKVLHNLPRCCRFAVHESRVTVHESFMSRTVPVAQSAATTNTGWYLHFNILMVPCVILLFSACLVRTKLVIVNQRVAISIVAQCLHRFLSQDCNVPLIHLENNPKNLCTRFPEALKCNLNQTYADYVKRSINKEEYFHWTDGAGQRPGGGSGSERRGRPEL